MNWYIFIINMNWYIFIIQVYVSAYIIYNMGVGDVF